MQHLVFASRLYYKHNLYVKSIHMQKLLVSSLLVLSVWTLQAQGPSGHTPPYIQKSLSGAGIHQVNAETSGGNITVSGVADGEARLEVYVRGNNDQELSKDEIQRKLDEDYTLTISTEGGTLTASARPKPGMRSWRNSLSVSFRLYVPQSVSSMLRTSGGNISIKSVTGTQDFRTSGGNLDVDQLGGKVIGRTSGGNVSITDSKDDLDLSTSGGNIEASNCNGNIHLATSGGNLVLRLLGGTIRATTSGGTVRGEAISGELATRTSGGNVVMRDITCSLEASTSGGNIDVSCRALGKYLNLRNSSGDVSVVLPGDKGLDLKISAEKIRHTTLNNFKGDIDEHHLNGTVNGGGIPVSVDNSGGSVSLTFK